MSQPEEHKPYIPASQSPKDFTIKAVVVGAVFGILFGTANAYLGLMVGLTVSTAIPLAVMSVALFKLLQPIVGKSTILENNIAQTTGSASSSLASGVIFTIPALYMWGVKPQLIQVVMLALLGGILGILFMIPLRRYLIVKEHGKLPYPEGTAAAEVLIAADTGGARARNVFIGLIIGMVYKAFIGLGKFWSANVVLTLPVMRKAVIGIEATPALLGVGYILGYRISAIMVVGGLISWVGLIPLIAYFGDSVTYPLPPAKETLIAFMTPKQIWHVYIRQIGAGAVAFAGIITVIRSLPMMVNSLRSGLKGFRGKGSGAKEAIAIPRTDRDLPFWVIGAGVLLVVLVAAFTPFVLGSSDIPMLARVVGAVCIAVFAFIFVTVSSRIVGLIGVSSNPTSGMVIVTLICVAGIFYALGWTDATGKVTALTIGTVVCVAASIAGDISQDLKAGYLIGATPAKQQAAELIGAATSAFFICLAVWLLSETYGFGTKEGALAAPQATLMKTIIDGIISADLPWGLVFIGVAIASVAELLRIPSLPFAVGIYLPLSAMTPIFIGGCLRSLLERRARGDEVALKQRKEQGILFGSGLIAGEGLMGVLIALYAFIWGRPKGIGFTWPPILGEMVSMAGFTVLVVLMIYFSRPERAKK